jgi:hypothetical protein
MDTIAQSATLPASPEFARRAAIAWIRAADAGTIDADELTWLLAHLPPETTRETQASTAAGPPR